MLHLNKLNFKSLFYTLTLASLFTSAAIFTSCSESGSKKNPQSVSSIPPYAPKNPTPHPYSALFGVWKVSPETIKKNPTLSETAKQNLLYIAPSSIAPSSIAPSNDKENKINVIGIHQEWAKLSAFGPFIQKLPLETFDIEVNTNSTLPINVSKTFALQETENYSTPKQTTPIGNLEVSLKTGSTLPGTELTLTLSSPGGTSELTFVRHEEGFWRARSRFFAEQSLYSARMEISRSTNCPGDKENYDYKNPYWTIDLQRAVGESNIRCANLMVVNFLKQGGTLSQLSSLFMSFVAKSGEERFNIQSLATLDWAIRFDKSASLNPFLNDEYQNYGLWGVFDLYRTRSSGEIASYRILESLITSHQETHTNSININLLTLKDLLLERVTALRWENPTSNHINYWTDRPFHLLRTTFSNELIQTLVKDLTLSTSATELQDPNRTCVEGGVLIGSSSALLNLSDLKDAVIFRDRSESYIYPCYSPTKILAKLTSGSELFLLDKRINAFLDLGLVPSAKDEYFNRFIKGLGNLSFSNKETLKRIFETTPDMHSAAAVKIYRTGLNNHIQTIQKYLSEEQDKIQESAALGFSNAFLIMEFEDQLQHLNKTREMAEAIFQELGIAASTEQ